jgi:alkanesulfonate monooxygenase SsuD/methylene tetrahydromethanopterin reductase-like flavin-dependent oxidoreductase (luciferase family)
VQYGVIMATKIDDWKLIVEAEELGYHRAWVPDSQMIWSDCYATLALAAEHTSRIQIGTGVSIPGTRAAPVTAHSIASINQLAPGRTFLGIGTGHTAMRVMGMDPMPIREFREYLRVVRALLAGDEVEYTLNGVTKAIRFLHLDYGFVNLRDPIPIYIAANGPLALRTVGRYGDGLMSVNNDEPAMLRSQMELVRAGAEKAGRTLPENFHVACLATAVVLEPGEKADSERVVDECGSQVTCALHFVYEIYQQTKSEEVVPPYFRGVFQEYCDYVAKMATPAEKRFQQIHMGHCTFLVPAERHFVTKEAIQGVCLVGTPDQIVERLRRAEKAGLREITLLPPMKHARKVFRDFSEKVMARY